MSTVITGTFTADPYEPAITPESVKSAVILGVVVGLTIVKSILDESVTPTLVT